MASQRNTAEAYRTRAFDLATAKTLSKAELVEALLSLSVQGGLDTDLANNIFKELVTTRSSVLQASKVESKELCIEAYLTEFESRFHTLKKLRTDLMFDEVQKALRANPDAVKKLIKLDAAGFMMNVFRSSTPDEIVFRTAQPDVTKIDDKYRTIMADKQAQLKYPEYKVNGNAEEISESLGVEVADPKLYEQLRLERGFVWLKIDTASRESGNAFVGYSGGIYRDSVHSRSDFGSFCAALRVKKA